MSEARSSLTGVRQLAPVFVCLLWWAIPLHAQYQVQAEYRAGVAMRDLTPSVDEAADSCLGGYGYPFSRCGSKQVQDAISVRCLALSDAHNAVLWMVLDTVGVGDGLAQRIRSQLAVLADGAMAGAAIFIAATHTHSGPDLQGLWGGIGDAYAERIVAQAADCGWSAWQQQEAVTLQAGVTQAAVKNRRHRKTRHRAGSQNITVKPDTDRAVALLVLTGKSSGAPLATLVNMSAHPVILDQHNRSYSAGYVHPLRETIETRWGGVTLFFNGILGDAIPAVLDVEDKARHRDYAQLQRYGREVAAAVLRLLESKAEGSLHTVSGPLQVIQGSLPLEIDNLMVLLAAHIGLLDVNVYGWDELQAPVALITLGSEVAMLSVPGEVLAGLGIPLKDKMPGLTRFWLGLTNGSYGYFMPAEEYGAVVGHDTEEQAAISQTAGEQLGSYLENLLQWR